MNIYSESDRIAIESLFNSVRSFYYDYVEGFAGSRTDNEWIAELSAYLISEDVELCKYDKARVQLLLFQRFSRHALVIDSTAETIASFVFNEEFRYSLPVILQQIFPEASFYTYLHIPKTAGTFVEHVLHEYINAYIQYRPEYLQRQRLDLDFPGPSPLFFVVKLYEFIKIFGHIWISGHNQLFRLSERVSLARSPKNFTVLRAPAEIIISAANYFLKNVENGLYSHLAVDAFSADPESVFFHDTFFAEFENPIKTTLLRKEGGLDLKLVRYLIGTNSISVLRSINDLPAYMREFHGIEGIENRIMNQSNRVFDSLEYLSKKTRDRVSEYLINYDQILYEELS